jgi:hypothetical protein
MQIQAAFHLDDHLFFKPIFFIAGNRNKKSFNSLSFAGSSFPGNKLLVCVTCKIHTRFFSVLSACRDKGGGRTTA